jgi:hypothetical protein
MTFPLKSPHNQFNKNRHDWILENKFEYGYFKDGGRALASVENKNLA